jgi:anti-sigma factor RsiW
VEPVDRLAAYLAGELSADEHTALEAELARDAGLRAELAAMRRADDALAGAAPTALPDGARERLLAALEPVFEAELGDPLTADAAPAARPSGVPELDELAARRRVGNRRSWLLGAGGVAAAVAAVALVGPILGDLGSGQDQADVAAMSADEARPESDVEATFDDAGSAAVPVGPTVVGSGRAIDTDEVTELLAAGELEAVVARGLTVDDARGLGATWSTALGADSDALGGEFRANALTADDAEAETPAGSPDAESAADDGADQESADEAADLDGGDRATAEFGTADVQLLGDVSEQDLEDVGRCLSTLVTPASVLVPALVELVTYQGEPAIAFALVGDAADGTVTRREVWILERQTCEVRYLRQG